MTDRNNDPIDRREVLRLAGRGIAAGCVALLGGALFTRSVSSDANPLKDDPAQRCVNDSRCRACYALRSCNLPRAQITRRNDGSESNG